MMGADPRFEANHGPVISMCRRCVG